MKKACSWVPPVGRFERETLTGDCPHTAPQEDTQWVKLNNSNAAIKTG